MEIPATEAPDKPLALVEPGELGVCVVGLQVNLLRCSSPIKEIGKVIIASE